MNTFATIARSCHMGSQYGSDVESGNFPARSI